MSGSVIEKRQAGGRAHIGELGGVFRCLLGGLGKLAGFPLEAQVLQGAFGSTLVGASVLNWLGWW